MCRTFEKLGMDASVPSIYRMVKHLSNDYNNELGMTFDEFMDQACDFFNQRDTYEGVSRIFSLFDFSDTGKINRTDMRRISNTLDIYLTSEQIDLMFQRASSDGDYITLEDFYYHSRVEK